MFSKIFVRLVNDIKSFDFDHIPKCPFWPMPLHFRNAFAASGLYTKLSVFHSSLLRDVRVYRVTGLTKIFFGPGFPTNPLPTIFRCDCGYLWLRSFRCDCGNKMTSLSEFLSNFVYLKCLIVVVALPTDHSIAIADQWQCQAKIK